VADAEGLAAHADSVRQRVERLDRLDRLDR
jgi:histidinol dehydrogenase